MRFVLKSLLEEVYFENTKIIEKMFNDENLFREFKSLMNKFSTKYGNDNPLLHNRYRMAYARIFKNLLKKFDQDIKKASDEFSSSFIETMEEDILVPRRLKLIRPITDILVSDIQDVKDVGQDKDIKTFNDFYKKLFNAAYEEKDVKAEISSSVESLQEGEDYLRLKNITVELDYGKFLKTKKRKYQVFVPLNHNASKILASKQTGGCLGDWCTAYPNQQEHWDDHVKKDGDYLVYMLSETIDNFSLVNKIAIVADASKTVQHVFDMKDGLITNNQEFKKTSIAKIIENDLNRIDKYEYKKKSKQYVDLKTISKDFKLIQGFVKINFDSFFEYYKIPRRRDKAILEEILISEIKEKYFSSIKVFEYVTKLSNTIINMPLFEMLDYREGDDTSIECFIDLLEFLEKTDEEDIRHIKEKNEEEAIEKITNELPTLELLDSFEKSNVISFIEELDENISKKINTDEFETFIIDINNYNLEKRVYYKYIIKTFKEMNESDLYNFLWDISMYSEISMDIKLDFDMDDLEMATKKPIEELELEV